MQLAAIRASAAKSRVGAEEEAANRRASALEEAERVARAARAAREESLHQHGEEDAAMPETAKAERDAELARLRKRSLAAQTKAAEKEAKRTEAERAEFERAEKQARAAKIAERSVGGMRRASSSLSMRRER